MIPSLLFLEPVEGRVQIEKSVFDDTHFQLLLSEKTLAYLRIPCHAREIAARQFVFQKMEDAAFRERFLHCQQRLTYLFQSAAARQNALNECEALFCFCAYASRYLDVINAALSLGDEGDFFNDFSQNLARLKPTMDALAPALEALNAPLFDIRTSKIWFVPFAAFAQTDAPTPGLMDRLIGYSRDLKLYELNLPEQKHIRVDHSLSDALIKLYPSQFAQLRAFFEAFNPLLSPEILFYREEIGFYRSIFDLCERAAAYGVPFSYPNIAQSPRFFAKSAYDFTLIAKECKQIIPNDIFYDEAESFFFLTGANGGGKTTYLRAVCNNLILAVAGCPVFCESAEIYPFQRVFTHFPTDESFDTGRLSAEQQRADEILAAADEHTFLFFNETFSGANDEKGVRMTLNFAENCMKEKIFGLFVTHFHEVNGHGVPVLSALVDLEDQNRRTYRIVRSEGLRTSYAEDILRKYRLSEGTLSLRDRMAGEGADL